MRASWTVGRTLATGFGLALLLNILGGTMSLFGLSAVVQAKDQVIERDQKLELTAQQLVGARSERVAEVRGYLLTGDDSFLDRADAATTQFDAYLEQARTLARTSRAVELLDRISTIDMDARSAQDELVEIRRTGTAEELLKAYSGVSTTRVSFADAMTDFADYESTVAAQGIAAADAAEQRDIIAICSVLAVSVAATGLVGAVITRRLRQRIGTAVGEVQTSSAELQTTADQQATTAMEQANAMSEISTTINQLLATSRQIGDSAQRVAQAAERTALAGGTGRATVDAAQQSMDEIRRQVEVIVGHMLELGEQSQQIGAVLNILAELAEQTNILAINSTIEAAGAGEAGRRFAVVADEIRKLADRVTESTKEVNTMIEVVRSAVHTTVMATEIGSKSVDAGSAQFEGVADQFEQIVDLVRSTTEAAREIELSTKQQTVAVEQVNFAVGNIARSTRESEAGAGQTLATASQLAELSNRLRRLIEPIQVPPALHARTEVPVPAGSGPTGPTDET